MKAELKVSGGKLIRADCEVQEGRIIRIKLTGDFFLHPEEALEELENSLRGVELIEMELKNHLSRFFDEEKTLLGVKPDDFAAVILNAGKAG